ncbi:MAG: multicopper oxidase domain-containing protein, partial [Actinomycetota bacterium]|nr:multicopper oxidase domain-containing protein [Actinomycetota bacterium]
MTVRRRTFLQLLGGAGLAAALPGCSLLEEQQTGEMVPSRARLPRRFSVPLPVPPVARPVRSTAEADFYSITQRAADVELLPGLSTPILGYDGIFPGPTIVSRSGRRTVVEHRNELTVPTVVHLHGGMRLQHVAWFAFTLAIYDATFITVVPLTNALVQGFLGYPLNPSFGMRIGLYNASIGIGDLLVYGAFTIAAYKAYGRQAAQISLVLVALFGAVAPGGVGLIFESLTDARTDIIVPAQTVFGPVAFVAYLWMRHHYGRERTMGEFLASSDVGTPISAVGRVVPGPSAAVPAAAPAASAE